MASWHGGALRRRDLALSDVAAQRRTVGSERYCAEWIFRR
jgi:hypothetical protein